MANPSKNDDQNHVVDQAKRVKRLLRVLHKKLRRNEEARRAIIDG